MKSFARRSGRPAPRTRRTAWSATRAARPSSNGARAPSSIIRLTCEKRRRGRARWGSASRTPRECVTDGFVAGAPGMYYSCNPHTTSPRSLARERARENVRDVTSRHCLASMSRARRRVDVARDVPVPFPFLEKVPRARLHRPGRRRRALAVVDDARTERGEVDETRDRRRGGDASGRVARDRGVA